MRLALLLFLSAFMLAAHAAKPQDPVTPWAEAHAFVVDLLPVPTVAFTARGSFDPDNNALFYSWDFGDGNVGSGLDVVHTYSSDGFYVAVLTVTDSQGLFDVSSVELRLTSDSSDDGNLPPIAVAGPDQSVSFGSVVLLDGFGSTDPDGDILAYSWSFVDIPATSTPQFNNASVVAPSFEANTEGDYRIRLTVNDGFLSDSDEVLISVALP